jgi:DNA-binding transcriptional MerR regulator
MSEIKPATDDAIAEIQQYLYSCGGLRVAGDAMVIPNMTVAAIIARIEAETAKNAELTKEVEQLRRERQEILWLIEETSGDCTHGCNNCMECGCEPGKQHGHMCRVGNAVRRLRAASEEAK